MIKLLALAALMVAAPAVAEPTPPAPPSKVDPLVKACRVYVRIAYLNNDAVGFNEYVDWLLRQPGRNRDEIVACSAYILGAMDMAEGRIVPARPVKP